MARQSTGETDEVRIWVVTWVGTHHTHQPLGALECTRPSRRDDRMDLTF